MGKTRASVYLFQAKGLRAFKIGAGKSVEAQRQWVQSFSLWPIELVTYYTPRSPARAEKALQWEFRSRHLTGDWFELSTDDEFRATTFYGEALNELAKRWDGSVIPKVVGPCRAVVRRWTPRGGVYQEKLKCGHTLRMFRDFLPQQQNSIRRCPHCARELAKDRPENLLRELVNAMEAWGDRDNGVPRFAEDAYNRAAKLIGKY